MNSMAQNLCPVIGIIGFGSIAKKHLATAQELSPNSKFIVFSMHAEPSEIIVAGAIPSASIEDFLQHKPRLAIICSDAASHHLYMKRLYQAGVMVVIEKPLAATVAQAKEICNLPHAKTGPAVVAYNLRFSEALSVLHNAIEKELIGTVQSFSTVVGQALEHWRPGREMTRSVSASRAKGGGVLRELSHELDYLQYLFGVPEMVTGIIGQLRHKTLDVEDTAVLSLKYGAGDNAVLGSVIMDFTRWDTTRKCSVIGSIGTLEWDVLLGVVTICNSDGDVSVVYESGTDATDTRYSMWQDMLRLKFDKFCDLSQGLEIIRTIEKIEELQQSTGELGTLK